MTNSIFVYFTRVIATAVLVTVMTGCAMQPMTGTNGETYVSFNNSKLLSKEQAKLLKREERASRIQTDMTQVGFKYERVSPLFDGINYSVLSIFKNQFELLGKYKTLVDNHKDVMSFVNANKDKSPDELKAEARRLDTLIQQRLENEGNANSNKTSVPYVSIASKMKQYQQATTGIQAENAKLAAELLIQGVRLAAILRDNTEEILGVEGIAMLLNAHRLHQQMKLVEARLHMSAIANEFIDDEKAVIDITKEIQKIIDEQI